ncbi:MAG: sugar phosphate nucleotidyltransferase, partial [Acidimicrobiales bacterium]
MKAVVLVGGEGTRLRPLTLHTPKQMLPVGGSPMIERVLDQLALHGVDEAVLSLGYRPDAFLAAYPHGRCGSVRLVYAVEDHPLDTGGAIAFAARHGGLDETFLALNGDVLTDLDITALVDQHVRRGARATIALTPVSDPSAYGVVVTDAEGRVEAFVEKPAPGEAPSNWVNAGTYVLDPTVLDMIPAGERVSIERVIFPALAAEGSLYAMRSDASWIDAGTPEAYLDANLRFAGRLDGAQVDSSARVAGSWLGPGTRVGPEAVVEGSLLLDDVVV